MARRASKLPQLATILLAVLLLLPSAAVAKAIDATNTQRLDLLDGLIGPESVAFDRNGAGPYVSISDGRILKYGGEGVGWTTFSYSAISADRSHLIVALTGPCKLMRYWIRGSKARTSEHFADLPGYPDNVRPDGKGGYWVALHREKFELPFGKNSHLVAIRIGSEGEKLQEMRGPRT